MIGSKLTDTSSSPAKIASRLNASAAPAPASMPSRAVRTDAAPQLTLEIRRRLAGERRLGSEEDVTGERALVHSGADECDIPT